MFLVSVMVNRNQWLKEKCLRWDCTRDYVYNMSEIEIKRCLNCGDLVSNRTFMYDNPNFCTGQCKDGYQRN